MIGCADTEPPTPARAATSSRRVAANPRSPNRSSAASRISCGRASFRRHRAVGLVIGPRPRNDRLTRPPEAAPLLKNLGDLDADCPILSFMRLARTLGPIYRLAFPGGPGLVLVSSRELIHEFCDETRFDKKVHLPLEHMRALGGDGLFNAHTGEPNWGKAHRILKRFPSTRPPATLSAV